MRKKGVSPVMATVILVAVSIVIAVAVTFWMSEITSQYAVQLDTPDNCTDEVTWEWESVDVFNGTDKGYRGCMFKYNTTVFVDCSGNGWLLYENSTHAFVQQIATFDGWTILKKTEDNR